MKNSADNIFVLVLNVSIYGHTHTIQHYITPTSRWHCCCFWDWTINSHTQVLFIHSWPMCLYSTKFIILKHQIWIFDLTQGKQGTQPAPKYWHTWGEPFSSHNINYISIHDPNHKVAVSDNAGTVAFKQGSYWRCFFPFLHSFLKMALCSLNIKEVCKKNAVKSVVFCQTPLDPIFYTWSHLKTLIIGPVQYIKSFCNDIGGWDQV